MSNVIFAGLPNYGTRSNLTAGSARDGHGVARLQRGKLSRTWRSLTTAAADTWVGLDNGAGTGAPLGPHIMGFSGLVAGNFTASAMIRVSYGNTWHEPASGPLTGWDSGQQPVFPDLAYTDGADGPHAVTGYLAPFDPRRLSRNAWVVPPHDLRHRYRYGRLDVIDPTNPDGYIEAGGLVSGPAVVPPPGGGIQPGWSFEVEDLSQSVTSRAGSDTFFVGRQRRVIRFSTDWMALDYALANVVQRIDVGLGAAGALVVLPLWGPAWLLGTYGRFRRLSGITESHRTHYTKSYELAEIL